MSLSDPDVVRAESADERGLEARASVYQGLAGPDARDVAFAAVAACAPTGVLEVGRGRGEFAARIRDEVTPAVVAVDVSPRMVELARARGIDAFPGDVIAHEHLVDSVPALDEPLVRHDAARCSWA